MIAEMRTYTVKDGMLETYLQLFNKLIVPKSQEVRHPDPRRLAGQGQESDHVDPHVCIARGSQEQARHL